MKNTTLTKKEIAEQRDLLLAALEAMMRVVYPRTPDEVSAMKQALRALGVVRRP